MGNNITLTIYSIKYSGTKYTLFSQSGCKNCRLLMWYLSICLSVRLLSTHILTHLSVWANKNDLQGHTHWNRNTHMALYKIYSVCLDDMLFSKWWDFVMIYDPACESVLMATCNYTQLDYHTLILLTIIQIEPHWQLSL